MTTIGVSQSNLLDGLHPTIAKLAAVILSHWQQYFELSPYELPEGLGYIEGKLEGDKLTIQNRCYQTPQFRKLHLELAKVGKNLDILHCVMFPRPDYPLPMFGCDIVAGKAGIGAAIADLSPTTPDKRLSRDYEEKLAALPLADFSQPRELPPWGDIFSPYCLFVRPANQEEEGLFVKIVADFLDLHSAIALNSQAVSTQEKDLLLEGQRNYCNQQRKNDKTFKVLEKAFGFQWANHYMDAVLFDLAD